MIERNSRRVKASAFGLVRATEREIDRADDLPVSKFYNSAEQHYTSAASKKLQRTANQPSPPILQKRIAALRTSAEMQFNMISTILIFTTL